MLDFLYTFSLKISISLFGIITERRNENRYFDLSVLVGALFDKCAVAFGKNKTRFVLADDYTAVGHLLSKQRKCLFKYALIIRRVEERKVKFFAAGAKITDALRVENIGEICKAAGLDVLGHYLYRSARFVNECAALRTSRKRFNAELTRTCKEVEYLRAVYIKLYDRKNSFLYLVGCRADIAALKGLEFSSSC